MYVCACVCQCFSVHVCQCVCVCVWGVSMHACMDCTELEGKGMHTKIISVVLVGLKVATFGTSFLLS